MATSEKYIEHPGVIERVDKQLVFVRIESKSACGNCHARSQCSMSEMQEKLVEVQMVDGDSYKTGQKVTVTLERSLGFQALLLGYMIPFLIVLVSIIILLVVTDDELISALVGIGLLLPYYGWLFSVRKSLKDRFYFKILR